MIHCVLGIFQTFVEFNVVVVVLFNGVAEESLRIAGMDINTVRVFKLGHLI
jgi:hypothetical protein